MPNPSLPMVDRLTNYIKAAFPGVALETHEEARALADVSEAAKRTSKELAIWSASTGLQLVTTANRALPETEDLLPALKAAAKLDETVVCLRDAHTWPWDRDPMLGRALRDALHAAPTKASSLVFVGSNARFHATCEKLVTVLPYDLPGEAEFRRLGAALLEPDEARRQMTEEVLLALSGLGLAEAENALALSLVECGRFDASVIFREKVAGVRRTGLLDIISPDPRGLDAIGGLEIIKRWILKRRTHFTKAARAYGLSAPKGILVVGVQGTGKSALSNAVATVLGVPMLALDMGKLLGSLVGESEERTRTMWSTARAMAPCVLRLDEIDKGLSGTSARGAESDGGVGRRVLGTMLTEMQENTAGIFIIATANDAEAIDAALLRKGRFDEVFSVDLPHQREREAILDIHVRARRRDPKRFDLRSVARQAEGFTGAELEAAVNEALTLAFDDGEREVQTTDLMSAIEAIVPLSRTAREKVDAIREWAKTRARPASEADAPASAKRKITAQSLN